MSLSSTLRILPLAVRGSSGNSSSRSGQYCRATPFSARNVRMSSIVNPGAPDFSTTTAQARSCSRGSGRPTTATAATSGCS